MFPPRPSPARPLPPLPRPVPSPQVWDLGSEPGGTEAGELASTYVYESVRALAADWAGEEATAAGRVLLGAKCVGGWESWIKRGNGRVGQGG